MRWLDNRIPPPVVGLLVALAMWGLARWFPVVRFALPWPWLLCLAVALLGGIVSTAGARAFRRVRTTVNPLHPERASSMVTSGIFRFTRNPMYVGIALVLLGFFLAFGALSAILGLPAFVGYITRFQILPEERILEAKFGSAYAAYRARVRRWL
ncbi:MAG: isoprenylcysteine carboxylmethyltransferase family protein [Rhodoferax sp.]|nr:isoprenylcysteine carboxylmethyltransferase family protein [Rhodoferax sp.]